jgi:hypothetical protein
VLRLPTGVAATMVIADPDRVLATSRRLIVHAASRLPSRCSICR